MLWCEVVKPSLITLVETFEYANEGGSPADPTWMSTQLSVTSHTSRFVDWIISQQAAK